MKCEAQAAIGVKLRLVKILSTGQKLHDWNENRLFFLFLPSFSYVFPMLSHRWLTLALQFTVVVPKRVLTAYKHVFENLLVFNAVAGGLGLPYARRCGTPTRLSI